MIFMRKSNKYKLEKQMKSDKREEFEVRYGDK